MSDDTEKDVQRRTVERYFEKDQSDGNNKPHKILIGNNAFSTFDDATMDGVEDGAVVSFDFETNGQFNNITKGSLVVHDDEDADEADASDDKREATPEPPRDARIRRQVALKAGVEYHKDRDATPDAVIETAETFNEWLKGGEV